jgi:flagellar basal-body rod modification protein FlgD
MTTITAPGLTASTSSSTKAPAAGSATAITSDFETFLRMLTVQMQNQDPLNPIDSADYAVQLATFSGVEQQVRTNQLLADMQGQFQRTGLTEMAAWIGKEARTDAPVRFDGTPVTLAPTPAPGATSAVLVVRDAEGRLVARETMPVSSAPYQWLGADAQGNRLPPGSYAFSVESRIGDTVVQNSAVQHYARVIEAQSTPQGPQLVLEGGIVVPIDRISALRGPQG